jgi:hypothetical protein
MLLFHVMERSSRQYQSKLPLDRLLICVAVLLMIGGVIVRTRIPIIPLADGDTWGYLRPALFWLSGFGFPQTYGRDWLYPALLAGILKVGGDFSAITYVQRFLGLSGIMVFWLAWRSWFRLLPARRSAWRSTCLVVTLMLLALYALNPDEALLENSIRPEGVLAFFELLYLYCLISFFLARWKWRRTGSTIAFGAVTLGLSYAILLLKPSWGFSLGFTFLALVASVFGRAPRMMRFGPLLAGAAALVFLFVLPKILGFQKDTQLFLPVTLVCIHSKQILETTPATVSPGVHNDGVPDRIFYEELRKAYRTAREQPSGYRTLGFQTDYIQYLSGFFSIIQREERWNDRELASACYAAYFRAWRQVPSSMLQKIGKQIRLFLFPRGGDFYSTARPIELDKLASSRRCLPDSRLSLNVQKIYQSYKDGLERVEADRPHPLGFQVLARLAHLLALSSLWLQLAFFVAITFVWLWPEGRPLRLAGLAILLVMAAAYGNALTIAIVHSLDIVRYRIGYAPCFLFGLAMIISYLLTLASEALYFRQQRNGCSFSFRAETRSGRKE